jgi:hypothetical protein
MFRSCFKERGITVLRIAVSELREIDQVADAIARMATALSAPA